MRKYIIIIAGLLLLALTACDGVDDAIDIDQEDTTEEETTTAKEREEEAENAEKEAEEKATKEWEEYRNRMLEHYKDAGVLEIQVEGDMDYEIFNVIVPNEFKLWSEEEKQYYVEEIGPAIQEDLESQFPDNSTLIVNFYYHDVSMMASAKGFGGWKVK